MFEIFDNYSAAYYSAAQHSAVQHSATHHSAAQHSSALHSAALNSATHYSAAQHSATYHSAMHHSATHHSAARHSATHYTAMFDMVIRNYAKYFVTILFHLVLHSLEPKYAVKPVYLGVYLDKAKLHTVIVLLHRTGALPSTTHLTCDERSLIALVP